jgi:hypothetical protein
MIALLIFIVVAVIVIATLVIGWDRYGSKPSIPSHNLQPTTEIFVDPETKRRKRVWYDATTGQREYRDEP